MYNCITTWYCVLFTVTTQISQPFSSINWLTFIQQMCYLSNNKCRFSKFGQQSNQKLMQGFKVHDSAFTLLTTKKNECVNYTNQHRKLCSNQLTNRQIELTLASHCHFCFLVFLSYLPIPSTVVICHPSTEYSGHKHQKNCNTQCMFIIQVFLFLQTVSL